jgi:hypothetical protein
MSQPAAKRFKKATKSNARFRLALAGPAGSGKTFSALRIAEHVAPKGKIAVIDSQRGQASKYANIFHFDVLELDDHSPETYLQAISDAEAEGYELCIIDSFSHAWMGKNGALELVDKIAKRSQAGNKFTAWREVTPMHNALVDAVLGSSMHIIATLRVKTEWVMEENERGKLVPKKVGMATIQREGIDYEFDVVGDMRVETNELVISKSHCPALNGGFFTKPGPDVAKILLDWVSDSAPRENTVPADQVEKLMNDPEIKRLFDKLAAPEAKRLATCKTYQDRTKLIAVLEARLNESAPKKDTSAPKNGVPESESTQQPAA